MDGGDLETRELRYFVAVAEELHFGRAAERLGIAQPPLSRAIRQLERRLGVTLVERTSRSARLTPAGEALLRDGRAALDAVAAAARRAQRAGHPGPRLVLVLKPGGDGGLLPGILARYEADPAAIPVEIVFSAAERPAMLRDGRADVGLLLHPPDDLTALDAEELRAEPQVLVLAESHPLAVRACVWMADLEGETLPRWPGMPGTGPLVRDQGQLMQLIALGRMVAVTSESVRDRLPSGLTCLPVPDAPVTTVCVAWAAASTSRPVAAFVRASVAVAGLSTPPAGAKLAETP
jgi:DNA-binding transcriptional LysR family regulator